jgi:hypothetical protein
MLVMAGVYISSLVALLCIGLRPAVPWQFVLVVPLLLMPFSIIFLYYSRQRPPLVLDVSTSAVVLVLFNYFIIWPIIAVGILFFTRVERIRWEWRLICGGVVTTILGYASLWNLNYLLARFVPAVHDPALRAVDEWVYSWFLSPVSYTGLFPVIHNEWLVRLFNNAYGLLFPEVILVLLLVCQTGEASNVSRFLKGLFGFYAIGVMCFIIYPAIGPCLYYPESLDPARADLRFVGGMFHDYQAAIHGDPLMGYGYFIAVPSLHVMVALYLQRCLAPFSGLYRLFLPVNIMVILSTVFLGYHYIVDVVFAVLIMSLWMILRKRAAF